MLAVAEPQDTTDLALPRLLVVDDDPNVHLLLRRLFSSSFALTFAENGLSALELLEKDPFDLVLLDVHLPDLSGFDVLRRARSAALTEDLPIVLISSLNENAAVVQGLQLGANDYITKPLDAEVVRARVNTQLALKRSTDERKQTIAELKLTQEIQENFTRIITHDLKGPLTNIRMAQFVLRDMLHDNPEAKSVLDNMDMTLTGMTEMLRVFLDAMETQQFEPQIEPVELCDLMTEVVNQHSISAERKRITLTLESCDFRVRADSRLLRQVLSNLVSNAIKFSRLDTHTRLWAEACGMMIRLCVADGGPGIPADERDLLFSMFGKLSTRPTGGENSTGLGLWIVKQLTALQQGRVGVDQLPEGGSLFWVELPAAELTGA